jgi:hypothetical protein
MADDLERLVIGDRRPHHLLDIPGVTYPQRVHNVPPCPLLLTSARATEPALPF